MAWYKGKTYNAINYKDTKLFVLELLRICRKYNLMPSFDDSDEHLSVERVGNYDLSIIKNIKLGTTLIDELIINNKT